MTTEIVYSDMFQKHDSMGHPENAQRLQVLINAVRQSPLLHKVTLVEPTPIAEELLHTIHTEEMIQHIKTLGAQGGGWIGFDTYVCPADYEIARLAAGGVVQLCEHVHNGTAPNGFALVRPPGHHATATQSMGFCLFNNIALAAHALTQHGQRVLIIDPDVHHGNGTQQIFYTRNDVLYQSFHLSPHYPGTGAIEEAGIGEGEGYTVNAPLGHGNGTKAVTQLLKEVFLPIAQQYKPDFILVSVGYDSHHAAVLGGLRLTLDFFKTVIEHYQAIQPKLVCTLEGGYNLNWIGKCLLAQLSALTNTPLELDDTATEYPSIEPVIQALQKEHGSYWSL